MTEHVFLTCHIAVDEPWPNFATNEQEEAILQHAVWEYSWLDPADGTRELICTQPYVYGSFFGYYDGKICYYGNFRNANTPEQQVDVLCFDTADGQEKTLMENWPCDTSAFVPPTFYPAFSGQSAPLVCAIKKYADTDLYGGCEHRKLEPPADAGRYRRAAGCCNGQWPVGCLPLTRRSA